MDQGLNWNLAATINGLAGHVSALDTLGVFLANDLVFLIVLSAAVWWFLPFGDDWGKRAALAAAAAVACGLAVSALIGHLIYVPRPFVAHHVQLLVHHGTDSSFPSDHAAAAFGVAGTSVIRRMPWRWLLLVGAVLVAIARVYVGVHYPADVVVGALIGTFWAIVFFRLDRVLAPPANLAIGVARRFRLG